MGKKHDSQYANFGWLLHFRPADGNNRLQKQSFLTAKLLRTLIEKDR